MNQRQATAFGPPSPPAPRRFLHLDPVARAVAASPGLRAWLGALLTTASVLLGLLPVLGLLIEGTTWVRPAVLCVLAVAALGALSRQFLGRSWPAWPLQGLVAVCAFALTALAPEERLGPFPSPGAGPAISETLVSLGSVLRDEVAPVRPVPEVVGVLCAAVALIAWLVDALVNAPPRTPLLAAVPLGTVAVAISFFVSRALGPWVLAGLAAALFLLLLAPRGSRADERRPAGRRRAPGQDPGQGVDRDAGRRSGTAGTSGRTGAPAGWGARWLAAGAVSAVALGGAALAPAVLLPDPSVGLMPEGSRFISPGSSTGVDPILDLSRDLRSPLSRTVLRYTTSGNAPVYLRTSVVEDLLTGTWGPPRSNAHFYEQGSLLAPDPTASQLDASTDGVLPAQVPSDESMAGTGYTRGWLRSGPLDDYLDDASWPPLTREPTRRESYRVGVDASGYSSPWLPLPNNATRAGELPSEYSVLGTSGALRQSDGNSISGGSYWAAVAAAPNAERLAASPSLSTIAEQAEATGTAPNAEVNGSKEDRERIPASIRDLAARIVSEAGAEGHPSAIANALREHLTGEGYRYSERAPVSLDGRTGGLAMVERFLKDKSGYCVHYASAMVLMARSQGIPARLALGYAPGTATGADAKIAGVSGQEFSVDSRSAHAWAQLYFVGLGWVDVDPTPGRTGTEADEQLGSTTAVPSSSAAPSSSASRAPETLATDPRPGASRSNAVDGASASATGPTAGAGQGPQAASGAGLAWLAPLLIGLGAAAVAAAAWLLPRWFRRRTMQRIRASGPGAAGLAWRTLERAAGRGAGSTGQGTITADDPRGPAGAATAPSRENLPAPERAAAWFPTGDPAAAAARLAAAADRERFGPPAPAPAPADPELGARLADDLELLLAELTARRARGHA
ncbi:DUF3488 and transglutaminase-like domain-containing protein [Galactobacter valiniphilus]|nr:transglutaminase domain-containing protein [Galactobacter valiniphilus]